MTTLISPSGQRLYKVRAVECRLRPGDAVVPATTIGRDWGSGEPVYALASGIVRCVAAGNEEGALAILVSPTQTR